MATRNGFDLDLDSQRYRRKRERQQRLVPVSVAFVWSASNTISPTSSQQPGAQFSNNGHNYWGAYVNGPGTPGNYFLWAIAKDVGANVVAACVFPSAFTFT